MMACESRLENDTAEKHEVVAHRRATLSTAKVRSAQPFERRMASNFVSRMAGR